MAKHTATELQAENIIRALNNDLLNATDKAEMLSRLAPNTVEAWDQTLCDINQLIEKKAQGYT